MCLFLVCSRAVQWSMKCWRSSASLLHSSHVLSTSNWLNLCRFACRVYVPVSSLAYCCFLHFIGIWSDISVNRVWLVCWVLLYFEEFEGRFVLYIFCDFISVRCVCCFFHLPVFHLSLFVMLLLISYASGRLYVCKIFLIVTVKLELFSHFTDNCLQMIGFLVYPPVVPYIRKRIVFWCRTLSS